MIDFDDDIFVMQTFNEIPSKADINNKILYPWTATPVTDQRILVKVNSIVSYGINYRVREIFAQVSEEEAERGVNMNTIKTYFGNPMMIRNGSRITKFQPEGHSKKCSIIGNSPNIKYTVYRLMDACRGKQNIVTTYFEEYDFLFAPSLEFILGLKDSFHDIDNISTNIKYDIVAQYRRVGTHGYNECSNVRGAAARERNLMMVLLLCLPQSKGVAAIDAYFEYVTFISYLTNFVMNNHNQITSGVFEQGLRSKPEINENNVNHTVTRLKDICSCSHRYAEQNKGYMGKFKFSVRGLIRNEYGSSLYRIEKAIKS